MFCCIYRSGDDWLNEKTGWEERRLGEKKEERILIIFVLLLVVMSNNCIKNIFNAFLIRNICVVIQNC